MIAKLENLSYKGRKVAIYDEKREKTAKWREENRLVEIMLEGIGDVLDMPFGTGRMLKIYDKLKIIYVGVDSSEEMLRHAYRKGAREGSLVVGDIFDANFKTPVVECVVCVRFFHLLSEKNMLRALRIICSLARRRVILTIQLGRKYDDSGSTVATHSEIKFVNAVRSLGWKIAETHTIHRLGWRVIRLERAR